MTWYKKLRLLYTFYLNFLLPGIFISLICAYAFYNGGAKMLPMLVWFKAITSGIFYAYIQAYKNKEFYYYYNLGFSKTQLWTSTLAFDFAIFILLLISAGLL